MSKQRLIEETTANFVKYDDKKTTAYLKLRQEIFQVYNDVIRGQGNEDSSKRIQELHFELDRTVQQYTAHIHEMLQILEINAKYPTEPYESDIGAQRTQLEQTVGELQDNIVNIRQTQKPLLDKMAMLVREYNGAGEHRGRHDRGSRRRGVDKDSGESTGFIKDAVTFTPEQITEILGDVGFDVDIPTILNLRMFDKVGENYVYRLTRQQVGRTIDEYERMISETCTSIQRELTERENTKERWGVNANKLERIRGVLERED